MGEQDGQGWVIKDHRRTQRTRELAFQLIFQFHRHQRIQAEVKEPSVRIERGVGTQAQHGSNFGADITFQARFAFRGG